MSFLHCFPTLINQSQNLERWKDTKRERRKAVALADHLYTSCCALFSLNNESIGKNRPDYLSFACHSTHMKSIIRVPFLDLRVDMYLYAILVFASFIHHGQGSVVATANLQLHNTTMSIGTLRFSQEDVNSSVIITGALNTSYPNSVHVQWIESNIEGICSLFHVL